MLSDYLTQVRQYFDNVELMTLEEYEKRKKNIDDNNITLIEDQQVMIIRVQYPCKNREFINSLFPNLVPTFYVLDELDFESLEPIDSYSIENWQQDIATIINVVPSEEFIYNNIDIKDIEYNVEENSYSYGDIITDQNDYILKYYIQLLLSQELREMARTRKVIKFFQIGNFRIDELRIQNDKGINPATLKFTNN